MIGSNSLSAFAQAIGRGSAAQPVRGVQATSGPAQDAAAGAGTGQRTLEAVPPPPGRPLPRGSLLDLRV